MKNLYLLFNSLIATSKLFRYLSAAAVVAVGSLYGYNTVSTSNIMMEGAPVNTVLSSQMMMAVAGDIVITEIMQNPMAVGDSDGEWFEVYNTTATDIDMNGWRVFDNGTNTFNINSSVIVPAGGYVIFGVNANITTNGGVVVDYDYPNTFSLGNADDELIIEDAGSIEIDRVEWDGGPNFPDPNGASMSLNPDQLTAAANDDGANWCEALSAYGNGDLGTPGSGNDGCCLGAVAIGVNDGCCASPAISFLFSDYTNSGVTPSCMSVSPNDAWFIFTPSVNGNIWVNDLTAGPPGFVEFAIYSGPCNDLTELTCGSGDLPFFGAQAGVAYYLQVYSDLGTTNDIEFCISEFESASNDECAAPIALTLTEDDVCTFEVDTDIMTGQPTNENNACNSDDPSLWYSFTAPNNGNVTFNSSGAPNFARAAVFTGSCGNLSVEQTCISIQGGITIPVTSGTTYLVQIYFDVIRTFCDHSLELCLTFEAPSNQAPEAICMDITVDANGVCQGTADAENIDDGSSDPDADVLTFSVDPEGPYDLGVSGVTLTVSDGDLEDECTATITVNDTVPPVFVDISEFLLYENDFEAPNSPVNVVGCFLDVNGEANAINNFYSTPEYTFQQKFTVEVLLVNGAGNWFVDPTGQAGDYAIGMLSTTEQDRLSLTFDTQGKDFLNIEMDFSAIDLGTCFSFGVDVPIMELSLYNSPGGSFNINAPGTLLDQKSVTGIEPGATISTFNWATVIAGLDASASTDGNVTLVFNLTQSGYAAFDNLVITASNISAETVCPENITLNNDMGDCGAIVNFNDPLGADLCSETTTAQSEGLASGDFYPVGATTNIFIATDEAQNTAACIFTVTVEDVEAPVNQNGPPSATFTGPANLLTNVPEANGYNLLYQDAFSTSLSNASGYDDNNAASLSNTSYTRVAYYLELESTAFGSQWVWVSMDDYSGGDLTKVGLPFGFFFDQVVTNMNVQSNVAGIVTGTGISTGNIEIAPSNYATSADGPATGGANVFDFDDSGFTGGGGYGCLQIHNYGAAQTLFSVNRFTANVEMGIGNRTTSHPDWTTANNGSSYSVKNFYAFIEAGPGSICADNPTVILDNSGNGSISVADVGSIFTDNCSIDTEVLSQSTFTTDDLGENEVILTVTDVNGNVSTCSSTVTVEEPVCNTPPTAICQNITVTLDENGNASTTVEDVDNGSSSTCGDVDLSLDQTTFNCDDLDDVTVTLTVTDVNDASAECTANVTVTDNTPPIPVCEDITVFLDADGQASITAQDVDGGSTDNCGVNSLGVSNTEFGCNTAAFALAFDGQNDFVMMPDDIVSELENFSFETWVNYIDNGFWTRIFDIGINSQINMFLTPKANRAPNIGRPRLAITLGGSTQEELIDADITMPTGWNHIAVTLEKDQNTGDIIGIMYINGNIVGTNTNMTLTPSDLGVTTQNLLGKSQYPDPYFRQYMDETRIWSVTRTQAQIQAGMNTALSGSEFGLFLYYDYEDGPGSNTVADKSSSNNDGVLMNMNVNTAFIEPGVFSALGVGVQTVTLTVIDDAGLSSECEATVTVVDNEPPTAICNDVTIELNDEGQASIEVLDVVSVPDDNCGVDEVTVSQSMFDCEDVGDVIVIVTVTDVSGNTSNCTATITVEDNEAPNALCVQTANANIGPDETAQISVGDIDNGSSDNCPNFSQTLDITDFDCTQVGTDVTVTMSVEDQGGLTSTCITIVTVTDTEGNCVNLDGCGTVFSNSLVYEAAAHDGNGNYYAPSNDDNFNVFDEDGNLTLSVPMVDCNAMDVEIDASGKICIGCENFGTVNCYNPDGTLAYQVAPPIGAPGTKVTHSFGFGPNLWLYIINRFNPKEVYAYDENLVHQWTVVMPPNITGFLWDVDADSDGNVWVVTSAAELILIDPTGNYVTEYPMPSATTTSNILIDGNDIIYVTSIGTNSIFEYTNDMPPVFIGATGPICPGGTLYGTSIDPEGNFISTCVGNSIQSCEGPEPACALDLGQDMDDIAVCQDGLVSIEITVGGGTPPYSIEWSAEAGSLNDITIEDPIYDASGLAAGVYNLTATITDDAGCIDQLIVAVEVLDESSGACNAPPVAVCMDITVDANGDCQGTAGAADFDGGSTDPDGDDLTFTVNPEGPYALGETIVTLTVSDGSEISTCTATVIVEDNTPPTAVCVVGGVEIDQMNIGNSNNFTGATLTTNVYPAQSLTVGKTGGLSRIDAKLDPVFDSPPPTGVNITVTIVDGNDPNPPQTVLGSKTILATECDLVFNLDSPINVIDGQEITLIFTIAENASQPLEFSTTDTYIPGQRFFTNNSGASFSTTAGDLQFMTYIGTDLTVNVGETISPEDIDGGSSDNCGEVSLSIDQTEFTCDDLGEQTVILTVTDESGNTSTCSSTIYVVDEIDPEITCPADITVDNDAGECSAIVNFEATATDNCSDVTIEYNPESGSTFTVGTTSVTATATDGSGNTDECVFNVKVNDTENPMAICQDVTVEIGQQLTASVTESDVNNVSSDNCGVTSIEITDGETLYDCDDVNQTFILTLTVTDNSDNTSTCTSSVKIKDPNSFCNEPPVAVCKDITVDADENCQGTAEAADFDGGSTDPDGDDLTFTVNPVAPYELGVTDVTLSVSDGTESSTCMATITVQDNEAPEAICSESGMIMLDQENVVPGQANSGPTIGIAVGINFMAAQSITVGKTGLLKTIKVEILDIAGTTEFNLTILTGNDPNDDSNILASQDLSSDEFVLEFNFDNPAFLEVGDEVTFVLSLMENFDGVSTSLGDAYSGGQAWQTDFSNPDEFVVLEGQDLEFMTFIQTDMNVNVGETISPEDIDGGSTDNCGIASLSIDQTTFDCDDLGAQTVILTVTDDSGNTSTCSSTVNIVDEIDPEITCPADITVDNDSGECSAIVTFEATATDNCSDVTIDYNPESGSTFPVGTTTVTATATDGSGNTAECTFNVIVNDTEDPTIDCPANLTLECDQSTDVSDTGMATAVDNCGILDVTFSDEIIGGSCANEFTIKRTFTATDVNGNTNNCIQTIEVVDTTPPLLLCDKPGPMFCTEVVPDADFLIDNGFVQAIDACDPNPTIMVLGPQEVSIGCFTTLTYQFYAIDDCGNMSDTCSVVTQFLLDDGAPEITCSNPPDLGCNPAVKPTPQSLINDGFVNATDGCGQVAIGVLPQRDTTVTECDTIVSYYFKASDFCNNQSEICTVQVTWRVNTPIVLECPENLVLECSDLDIDAQIAAWLMDVTVSDACNDEVLTNTYDPNNFTETCATERFQDVTFEVTDDCGDVASCVRRIEILDTTAPEITCPDDITIAADKFFCEKADLDTGVPTVTDNCDEPFTTSVMRSDGLDLTDPYPLGTTIITWTVTGECSEMSSSCTQTITVIDLEAPTVICKAKIFVAVNSNEGKVIVPDTFMYDGVFDNCSMDDITISVSKNEFTCMDFDTAMVDVCAIDGAGNEKCCEVLIILQDNFDPIAVCQDVTVTLDGGEATITPEEVDNGSTDNTDACGLELSVDPGTFTLPGMQETTLTVTDNSGNTATCTAQVLVKDEPSAPALMVGAKVWLESVLNASETAMIPKINDLLPLSQPFNTAPFNYAGTEEVITMPSDVIDWVLVELRDGGNSGTVLKRKAAFLLASGNIVDVHGGNLVRFENTQSGTYYLSIAQRNHLDIISAQPISMSTNLPMLHDFTTQGGMGTGTMRVMPNGSYAMWAGDTNGDRKVDAADRSNTWNDRNQIGYLRSDVNLDGKVDAADRSVTWNNRNKVSGL